MTNKLLGHTVCLRLSIENKKSFLLPQYINYTKYCEIFVYVHNVSEFNTYFQYGAFFHSTSDSLKDEVF